ncbi:unnamed protein product [Schistosoma mattheei]|uniref:Uncharacterized protein n=1 Tax=Schistosoma mattheei TaxID=31246 RepID=A0A183Q726_9TREM|nr:unnamed protein product [Schistosoma mattheei]
MVVGGSRQETLDLGFVLLGTRQHGVPVILRELVLLDGFDPESPSFTPHRISIRSISSHGQSKDAQCTLVVGRGMTATPARLKATQIGTKSAKLSWIPGNSNYYHRVYLNETSLHVCKPGVYKLHLTGKSLFNN